jgi:hypothetical protein
VETQENAERVGFRGSPTILVDLRDPWADAAGSFGLSCRICTRERRGRVAFGSPVVHGVGGMSTERPIGLAALGAIGLGVCCALPVQLRAGALTAALAICVGAAAVAAVGVVIGTVGLTSWHRPRRSDTTREHNSPQGVN